MVVAHIAEMYPQVAKHDANHDGTLDETEQATLAKAIDAGELHLPHGEHSDSGDHAHE
jgi:hypothetical protein